jgi:acyl dehydratase
MELMPTSLEVDQRAIENYARLTNDFNPIHLDRGFAKTTPFGDVIAHGTMSLSLILQSLTRTLGLAAAKGARLEVRFVRPVRIGDVVTATGRRSAADDRIFEVQVTNDAGEPVIEGRLRL